MKWIPFLWTLFIVGILGMMIVWLMSPWKQRILENEEANEALGDFGQHYRVEYIKLEPRLKELERVLVENTRAIKAYNARVQTIIEIIESERDKNDSTVTRNEENIRGKD